MRNKKTIEASSPPSLKANMLWNSIGTTVYLGFQWLLTIAVVRLSHGYDAAGVFALGMAVSNIVSPIGQYKVRACQVSDVNGEFSVGQYIGLRIVACVIALVVTLFYGTVTCAHDTLPAVFLYGVYSFGPVVVDVFHGEDQRQGRMDIIGKSFIVRGVLSFLSFCIVLTATDSLELSILAMTIATFSVIALYDCRKTQAVAGSIKPIINRSLVRKMLKLLFPAVLALFFATLFRPFPDKFLGSCLEKERWVYTLALQHRC